MPILQWVDIPDSEIDEESPVTEGHLRRNFQRQECLIAQPVNTRFDEVSTGSASYVDLSTKSKYVPAHWGTTGQDVVFVIVLEAKTSAGGTTGKVRARLGGTNWIESADVTVQSYARLAIEIPAADIRSLGQQGGTEKDLQIEGKVVSGGGTLLVRCVTSASRVEPRIS